jgi:predicted Zn-dependent protease
MIIIKLDLDQHKSILPGCIFGIIFATHFGKMASLYCHFIRPIPMKKLILSLALSSSLLFFNTCSVNPVTGKKQVMLMSESQEIAMGKEADPHIIAQFGLYESPELQAFINEKGKAMAAISHRSNLNYEFKVLDSDVVNAFAVPGGYVYFTRGIMAHFNNEAEFAGVLGHEIGHITARHSVSQQTKQLFGQLALITGMVIAPDLAQFAQEAMMGMELLFLKFSRDHETESDRLGVEYSSKVGYDAREMAGFFSTLERMGSKTGAELPDFLSTHPNPGNRQVTVGKLAKEWQTKLNLTDPKVNRNSYLQRLEGMIYGEDPKQGFLENNVFYHPELKFQFPVPKDWAYLNSPQRVQLASKDGKAMLMLMLAQGTSLSDARANILKQYGMQLVETKDITVNGLKAISMVADQKPEEGGGTSQPTLRTQSYLIQYGESIYHLIGIANMADYSTYVPTFTTTMQGFRSLSDPDKLNRKPERIRIKTVSQAATLEQALRNFNMPAARLEELAILNGMKLNTQVPSGTLIKVVGK